MKSSNKLIFAALSYLVTLSLLTACVAPQGAASTGGNAAAPEKMKIAYWVNPPDGSEAADCRVATMIDPFNASNDRIMVEAVVQPSAWDATRTAIAGGGGPDLVQTPGPSFVFELAQAGQLLALDDLADQNGWKELFVPWALNLGKVDGTLYSLPTEMETLLLYYNKTLFEQKGWTPPKTVDEMMALAKTIADEGLIPFAHGNADWRPTNEWFVGEFLNHLAGPDKVYEALTGKRSWDDPDFVMAIEKLNEIQQNGWFMGGLDIYYTSTFNDNHAAFGSGEAAMNIEGTWFMSEIDTFFGDAAGNTNEWDWVPVPSTGGEATFDIGIGSTFSINKNSPHPEAVAEFMSYMFSPEMQGELLSKCGSAPAPVRLKADALTSIDPRAAKVYESLGAASDAGNYGYTTWTFWPPKSDVYIYEQIEKVWAGDMTSEEYLAGLQALFAEELAAGDIPPIPER